VLIVALVIGGFAYYVMSSEERRRALRFLGVVLGHVRRNAELGLEGMRVFVIALLGRQRWAVVACAVLALLIAGGALHALHVRSFTDIRPAIDRVVAIEERTVRAYNSSVGQFRLGTVSAETLSNVIRHAVLPELQAAREQLKSLERVRPHQQPVLVKADEYLHLRMESWRLRAEALENHSMDALTKADRCERDSLAALQALRLYEL
jgi:hypothetical protein